jgi:hypothetical protein
MSRFYFSKCIFTSVIIFMFISCLNLQANAAEDIYSIEIKELPEKACAQCHYPVYLDLKNHGGAHKQACRDCHEKYHNFRRKLTWQERVPACTDCHETPHGESDEMTACMKCHENEHAPVFSIELETISPLCGTCHNEQQKQLADFQSAHSDMDCTECHQERHGNIPDCTLCHEEPHSQFIDNAHCTRCHDVHKPADIVFTPKIPNNACKDCHAETVAQIESDKFAHAKLKCVLCHSGKHGSVPTCQKCHDTPHSQEMIKEFGGCSECHGNPHSLKPVNKE